MKRRPVLRPVERTGSRTLSVRIPEPLYARIEAIKRRASDGGMVFPLGELMAEAVASAVSHAETELANLANDTLPDLEAACLQDANSEAADLG